MGFNLTELEREEISYRNLNINSFEMDKRNEYFIEEMNYINKSNNFLLPFYKFAIICFLILTILTIVLLIKENSISNVWVTNYVVILLCIINLKIIFTKTKEEVLRRIIFMIKKYEAGILFIDKKYYSKGYKKILDNKSHYKMIKKNATISKFYEKIPLYAGVLIWVSATMNIINSSLDIKYITEIVYINIFIGMFLLATFKIKKCKVKIYEIEERLQDIFIKIILIEISNEQEG